MGCYGIGISRLVATIIEQHHDDSGIIWPLSVAPYPVHIVQVGESDAVREASARIERELKEAGIEALVDDRNERPGVKFKDADLIGIPLRVTIGDRGLASGQVELKERTQADPKQVTLLPLEEAASTLVRRIRNELAGTPERG